MILLKKVIQTHILIRVKKVISTIIITIPITVDMKRNLIAITS